MNASPSCIVGGTGHQNGRFERSLRTGLRALGVAVSKFPQLIRAFQNASRAASGALSRHYLQGGAERCGTYIDALGCAVVDEREVMLMAGQVVDLKPEEWERICRHGAEMDAQFAAEGEIDDDSFLTKYEVPLGKFALPAVR